MGFSEESVIKAIQEHGNDISLTLFFFTRNWETSVWYPETVFDNI